MDTLERFLEHHGIKGQKWGIRNKKNRAPASEDASRISTLRKQPIHSLNNNQLREVTQRGELERKFRQLNPTKVKKGHEGAKTFLALAGTTTSIIALASSPTGKIAIEKGKTFINGPGKHFVKKIK